MDSLTQATARFEMIKDLSATFASSHWEGTFQGEEKRVFCLRDSQNRKMGPTSCRVASLKAPNLCLLLQQRLGL